jgi:hypothetical protein
MKQSNAGRDAASIVVNAGQWSAAIDDRADVQSAPALAPAQCSDLRGHNASAAAEGRHAQPTSPADPG